MRVAEENVSDSEPQSQSMLKILIAEDDPPSKMILEGYLCDYGDCTATADGTECVEAFKKNLEEGLRFDLICLDIEMPKMDGKEALKAIRKIEIDNGICYPNGVRVIMTTGQDKARDMIDSFDLGCEAYIVKPVKLEKLLNEMQKLELINIPKGG